MLTNLTARLRLRRRSAALDAEPQAPLFMPSYDEALERTDPGMIPVLDPDEAEAREQRLVGNEALRRRKLLIETALVIGFAAVIVAVIAMVARLV